MNDKNIEVIIHGFNTLTEAEEFCSWYEGQGEQDASIWFECRKDEGIIDVDTMNCKGIFVGGTNPNIVRMIVDPQ